MRPKLILAIIFVLAALLRLVGVNWDQYQHLHPDERFLTMVAQELRWPTSLPQYFDTPSSPLNPHNRGFHFYVYGTYPVILVKAVAESLNLGDYWNLNLIGRVMSAVVDLGSWGLVVLLAYRLFGRLASLWSGLAYALAVLPIQLSHYFASDPYAIFFGLLSCYLLLTLIARPRFLTALLLGGSFGLAVAAKVSAATLAPILGLGFLILLLKHKKFIFTLLLGLVFVVTFALTMRVALPYLFVGWQFNPKLLANLKELKSYDNPQGYFPPATMWVHATDYLFPLQNMALWGWGLPLFVVGLLGMVKAVSSKNSNSLLLVATIGWLFIYHGSQYAKPLRYFWLLYPLMGILMGPVLAKIKPRICWIVVLLLLIWPLAFVRIYTVPHSRVQASEWIYENIPSGTFLSCEHWDDCLPLNLPELPGNGAYRGVELPMFNLDEPAKWQLLASRLQQIDYLILSSNRVYGSTLSVPEKFPGNTIFYEQLFAGQLGFTKVKEFTSRPGLPWPASWCLTPPGSTYGKIAKPSNCRGLSFVDDYADETFTVYDHPKVIIFRKSTQLDYSALFASFGLL